MIAFKKWTTKSREGILGSKLNHDTLTFFCKISHLEICRYSGAFDIKCLKSKVRNYYLKIFQINFCHNHFSKKILQRLLVGVIEDLQLKLFFQNCTWMGLYKKVQCINKPHLQLRLLNNFLFFLFFRCLNYSTYNILFQIH